MRFFKNGRASGQATVEGAFLIPLILILLMLLIQPGILLYNRLIMQSAAAEGCRLLATRPTGTYGSQDAFEGTVLRHLGAVPQQENFHVHESGCSWKVTFEGNESSERVSVSIENQVKPLPFFDFGAGVLGLTNGEGNFYQKVQVSQRAKSAWVLENDLGLSPEKWVAQDGSTTGR
jgi:hypothetical protein